MNNKKCIDRLKKCIDEKSLCAIEREYIDTLCIYGYPTKMSDELCAVSFVYDFVPDGCKIIRKSDVTEIYCTEAESFLQNITEKENADFSLKAPDVCIDGMQELFDDLKQKKCLVTVECEDFEGNILLVGRVIDTANGLVTLCTFDGTGKWDDEPSSVDIDAVSCVTIGNSYMRIIEKYLK